jgi:hypothetical protein
MAAVLVQRGWRVDVFTLAAPGGVVLAALGRHAEAGAIFDSKFVAEGDETKRSESGLLRSLLRSAAVQSAASIDRDWQLPEYGVPQDHLQFYRDPKHLEAFAFLDQTPSLTSAEAPSAAGLVSEVICGVESLPAVAYARHDEWSALIWGRASARGGNPWPHPLA